MASIVKNTEAIKKFFGENFEIVVDKLKMEGISIKDRSTKFINETIYPIASWVDYIAGGDIQQIKNKTIKEMTDEYHEWFHNYKLSFKTENYIENNQILFDYRVNNQGYYWVNLNKHYDVDMIIRMNNCGRVNYGDTLIELRENVGNVNLSHVAIVIGKDGTIYQIKGQSNNKPEPTHHDYIFDFLLNYEQITRITVQFEPENDFKINDLNKTQREVLFKAKPFLFKSLL